MVKSTPYPAIELGGGSVGGGDAEFVSVLGSDRVRCTCQ